MKRRSFLKALAGAVGVAALGIPKFLFSDKDVNLGVGESDLEYPFSAFEGDPLPEARLRMGNVIRFRRYTLLPISTEPLCEGVTPTRDDWRKHWS